MRPARSTRRTDTRRGDPVTPRDRDRTVYSSQSGRVCPHCQHPAGKCICRKSPRAPKGDGIVRVGRETKGRKGKTVTTVSGVPLPSDDLRDLAAELKRRCGSGGSTKDGVIEIQGDHRDVLVAALEERGFEVKRAGG
jgi:translation initiation factor 1